MKDQLHFLPIQKVPAVHLSTVSKPVVSSSFIFN